MSELRVGVAGVGRLGAEHARILATLPGCRLVGITDTDAARADEVATRNRSTAFTDLSDLLEVIEALVVAVPTPAHHSVARSALEAGVHVLVEKPLTPTLDEADDLIAVAARNRCHLTVGHVERYNPAILSCRPFLRDPRFIASERLSTFQPRGTDVPVMLDLMIHDIDLVLGLVESPVADVQAVGVSVLTDSVDMANARLAFENGAVAEISASRVSVERHRVLRLFQPSGYMSLDLAAGRGEFLRRKADVEPAALWRASGGHGLTIADIVERVPLVGGDHEPLRRELEAFRDTVQGRGSEGVSAVQGRAALAVALRIGREIERSEHVTAQDPRGA